MKCLQMEDMKIKRLLSSIKDYSQFDTNGQCPPESYGLAYNFINWIYVSDRSNSKDLATKVMARVKPGTTTKERQRIYFQIALEKIENKDMLEGQPPFDAKYMVHPFYEVYLINKEITS